MDYDVEKLHGWADKLGTGLGAAITQAQAYETKLAEIPTQLDSYATEINTWVDSELNTLLNKPLGDGVSTFATGLPVYGQFEKVPLNLPTLLQDPNTGETDEFKAMLNWINHIANWLSAYLKAGGVEEDKIEQALPVFLDIFTQLYDAEANNDGSQTAAQNMAALIQSLQPDFQKLITIFTGIEFPKSGNVDDGGDGDKDLMADLVADIPKLESQFENVESEGIGSLDISQLLTMAIPFLKKMGIDTSNIDVATIAGKVQPLLTDIQNLDTSSLIPLLQGIVTILQQVVTDFWPSSKAVTALSDISEVLGYLGPLEINFLPSDEYLPQNQNLQVPQAQQPVSKTEPVSGSGAADSQAAVKNSGAQTGTEAAGAAQASNASQNAASEEPDAQANQAAPQNWDQVSQKVIKNALGTLEQKEYQYVQSVISGAIIQPFEQSISNIQSTVDAQLAAMQAAWQTLASNANSTIANVVNLLQQQINSLQTDLVKDIETLLRDLFNNLVNAAKVIINMVRSVQLPATYFPGFVENPNNVKEINVFCLAVASVVSAI